MNNLLINLQYTTIKQSLPEFIYNDLKTYVYNANSYHPQPPELIKLISSKNHISPSSIFLTAGADEAIQLFIKAYGNNTYIFTPTYIVYKDVEVFGGKLSQLYSIKNDSYEIDTSSKKNVSLIFLANPNNPSGFTSREKVMELVRNNPHAIVVIDEAYGDFADLSVIDQVKDYPNMAVIRSFSKSFGMAGCRIGFIIASRNIIDRIAQFTGWCSVSYLSVGAAISALNHETYFLKIRKEIGNYRDQFCKFLIQYHFSIIPSKINCALIQLTSEQKATEFVNHLKKNNIIVSHGNGFSNIGLNKSSVRITIGTKEQMKALQKVIITF